MTARYEVKLELDIIGFKVADSEQEAIDLLSSEIENLLKGNGHQKMSDDAEVTGVDLQASEAEPI